MSTTNDQGISQLARTVMTFIDRVGFPIFAFIMMSIICFYSIDKMNKSVQSNTNVLVELTTTFKSFQGQVQLDHRAMLDELRRK